MVYGNKFLWELLIFKKLWFSAQEQNWTKQKVTNEKRKLAKMQKPTEVQLDETISEKVVAEIGSTVPNEVRSILAKTLTRKSFVSSKVSKKFRKAKTGTDSNETATLVIEHGSSKQKKRKAKKKQQSNINAAQDTTTNTPPGQNADTATIPVQVTQHQQQESATISTTAPQNPTQPVRNVGRGRGRGRFFGYGGGRTGGGRFKRPDAKQTGEIDAYCMSIAPLNIFENQVVPMGLHNFSKVFRPNIATTRVFSLGMKLIPVWKKFQSKNLLMDLTNSDVK